jgi:hypothetical protein
MYFENNEKHKGNGAKHHSNREIMLLLHCAFRQAAQLQTSSSKALTYFKHYANSDSLYKIYTALVLAPRNWLRTFQSFGNSFNKRRDSDTFSDLMHYTETTKIYRQLQLLQLASFIIHNHYYKCWKQKAQRTWGLWHNKHDFAATCKCVIYLWFV